MAVVSRLWKFGKNTGCYFVGAGKLALNPSTPIPKTDVHPRMPAFPDTFPELIRMLPYRHYWKFIPIFRAIVFGHCLILPIYLMSSLNSSKVHAQRDQLNHAIHSAEGALAYGRLQRKEDAKYFKEYDPKAQFRPKWFKDEISWMKLNYYPHGYSADH
ncbi:unnamed protein product [Meloidogyne enterolobii]|uniref:Uncharacterized protein n=2 Tax=Meloidogyne enterolobii TaxID=390850 RepID=A0ACB0ZCG0_MELEN|nr:unnamed protein product [Meloidogyne enterolobii]